MYFPLRLLFRSSLLLAGTLLVRSAPPVPRAQDPGPGADDPRAARVEATLDAMAELGRWSGTALVAHEGRVLVHRARGLADREHGVPNTVATRYRVASISKALGTSAGFAQA